MADPFNFKRTEQVPPLADFHGGDTHPLPLTAASGDMTAHRQDVQVNLIRCQFLASEAGMAVQGLFSRRHSSRRRFTYSAVAKIIDGLMA